MRADCEGGRSGRRRCSSVAGVGGGHWVQFASLHSPSLLSRRSWVMVGRREGAEGRRDDVEVVRDSGVSRGAFVVLWDEAVVVLLVWRSERVGRRGLDAGLWDATGAAVVAAGAAGLRWKEALGAESALLTVAAV